MMFRSKNASLLILLVIISPIAMSATKPSAVPELEWKELIKINTSNGKAPPSVQKLLKKPIKVGGFMLANEFEQGNIKEFLLTPVGQGCVHVPPPPANYVIHVKVADGIAAKFSYKPVLVHGSVSLTKSVDNRLMYSYEMVANKVEDYPMNQGKK